MNLIYLDSNRANRFLKRTFFHPGATKCEEQKREAREDYEERCEPSFPLFRNTGTRRFCPDIHLWKELDNYEIGDGYGAQNPIRDDGNNGYQNNDRNRYNTYDRNNNNKYRRPPTVIPIPDDTDAENNY